MLPVSCGINIRLDQDFATTVCDLCGFVEECSDVWEI
jgi:hypothetical protein